MTTAGHETMLARYASTSFSSAPPLRQRLAMLDGAIRAARCTAEALRRGADDRAHDAASIARALVLELLATLRIDARPAPSPRWRALYLHLHGRLARAVIDGEPSAADQVADLLESERKAWIERVAGPCGHSATACGTNAVA